MAATGRARGSRPGGEKEQAAADGVARSILVIGALALCVGYAAVGRVVAQSGAAFVTTALGVGTGVIVSLILEELLREVHETDSGPVEVAVLFAFFLLPRGCGHPVPPDHIPWVSGARLHVSSGTPGACAATGEWTATAPVTSTRKP